MTLLCPADVDVSYFNKCNDISANRDFYAAEGVSFLLTCGVDRFTAIVVYCIIALALLYFIISYLLLLLKLRGYRNQPYTFVQVGLVYNTLQVNFCHLSPFCHKSSHFSKSCSMCLSMLCPCPCFNLPRAPPSFTCLLYQMELKWSLCGSPNLGSF